MTQPLAQRQIIGVDYSGSQDDVPWITTAVLGNNGLALVACEPISRANLTQHLLGLCDHAGAAATVVGMDFPFGVANAVFPNLNPGVDTLLQVWELIAAFQQQQFGDHRDGHNGAMRNFDQLHYHMAMSPTNIRMWHMTYHGICMLWQLHNHCPNYWHIPPLDNGRTTNGRVTLLEVMPGAALAARGLPHNGYKGNIKGLDALDKLHTRVEIFDNLPGQFGMAMPNLPAYRDLCMFSDDALDSIVAAIVAALWATNQPFHCPENHHANVLNTARLEGCIFTPC